MTRSTIAPPCDPTSLWGTCRGGCGRQLHKVAPSRSRLRCTQGHPQHTGHGLCPACRSRLRKEGRLHEFPSVFTPDPEPGGPAADTTRPADDGAWKVRATCRAADPELFFPPATAGRNGTDLRPVAEVAWRWCQDCPVLLRCHNLAERVPDTVGIWGGSLRTQTHLGAPIERVPLVPAAPRREAS